MTPAILTQSNFRELLCPNCGKSYSGDTVQTYALCCNQPLIAKYTYPKLDKYSLRDRVHSMWRYREMLPLFHDENKISLGEGMTPINGWQNLSSKYELEHLLVKDEGLNPTGSFKARGQSMAISKAKELGITSCVIPTAGNAGGAMSAYCALASMKATVIMPRNTPEIFKEECEIHGAELILFDGLIDQCGKVAAQIASETGAFNMSTMKEPYRLEGKKTMGYEIAEQLNWTLPEVIIYPTGGGTGLIGMWVAFKEMIEMGWIDAQQLPKMIAVQSDLCPPIVEAFHRKLIRKRYKMSIANGLSVPSVFALDLILKILKESKGTAFAVSEQKILAGVSEIGASQGVLISPEGAAVWEALKLLIVQGFISRNEKVLLLNTGNGFKYTQNYH